MRAPSAIAFTVAIASAVAAGCVGVGGTGSAKTLPRGAQVYSVGPEVNGAGPGNAAIPTPEGAVGVRVGVGARVELDARLATLPTGRAYSTLGFEAGVKHQLRAGERLDIAVGARAGYRVIHSSGATWEGVAASVPLIVGVNLRRGLDQLVVAPRVGVQRWYSSGAMPVELPFAGASLGYSWRINRRFTIFPEVSIMRSSTEFSEKKSTLLVHTGVGFAFAR